VAAVDRITDELCTHEPLGLALFGSLAGCTGTATDTHLSVLCASQVSDGTCSVQGSLQLDVERSGESLIGSGAWSVTASGGCGSLVSGSEAIEISGARLGPLEQDSCLQLSSLAQKLVTHPSALLGSALPFAALAVQKAEIEGDAFEVKGTFTLGAGSDGIAPVAEAVRLQVGPFDTTLPAGSFELERARRGRPAKFTFEGAIGGVWLEVKMTQLACGSVSFKAEGAGAQLGGTQNPVPVALTIGNDGGATAVWAEIDGEDGDEDD
jgi:hypothetical protein